MEEKRDINFQTPYIEFPPRVTTFCHGQEKGETKKETQREREREIRNETKRELETGKGERVSYGK